MRSNIEDYFPENKNDGRKRTGPFQNDVLITQSLHPVGTRFLLSNIHNSNDSVYEAEVLEYSPSNKYVKLKTNNKESWVYCWDYKPIVVEVLATDKKVESLNNTKNTPSNYPDPSEPIWIDDKDGKFKVYTANTQEVGESPYLHQAIGEWFLRNHGRFYKLTETVDDSVAGILKLNKDTDVFWF